MKLKTTKKAIKENTYQNLMSVGYCDLQFLLRFKNPFAYSSGQNGWACDYYELENDGMSYIISTGYSPIGKRLPYDLIKKYEKIARDSIVYNRKITRKNQRLERLINKFLIEAEKHLNKA
tara:strand:+ start:94 stop:453 length:360 start_codon:yes stop_codon:yes gene_type:complete